MVDKKKLEKASDDLLTGGQHITDAKPLTIDEAKQKLKLGGDKARTFEEKVLEKQDGQFTKLMSVVFGWKLQKAGGKKLVSKMPSGKILFPDKSENLDEVKPGMPYMCLVYDRPNEYDDNGALIKQGKEAFAKIICEENRAKIFVPPNRLPVMVWTESNGKVRNKVPVANSYGERMMDLINMAEKMGLPLVEIVFRRNQLN